MNPALSRHLQLLGLERSPFPPTPDANAYYLAPGLEGELVEAAHALRTRAGIVLLTGEVGTGKSTFLRRLLDALDEDGMAVSMVFNTFLQGDDLLAAVLRDFGLRPAGNAAADIEALNRFLILRWQAQQTCVLIIDDAQNLDVASLELVRLLTSLETGQEKLLQIVLSGQPELREHLDLPQLRQLTSRVCKHVRLQPLDRPQTRAYVDFRLQAAGAGNGIQVSDAGIASLHRRSGGNPRRIHLVMDRCLYGLYQQPAGQRRIDAPLVRSAAAQAGVQPARHRRGRWAIASAGVLAAGLGLAGLILGNNESRAGTAPVATPVASALPTDAADSAWQHCVAGLGPSVQLSSIDAATAQRLQQAPHGCLRSRDGQWQLAWLAEPAPADEAQALAELQQHLASLGQYDGAIDGLHGRLTQRAIARFQQAHGLPASGQPDALTRWLLQTLSAPSSRTPDAPAHVNG